MNRDDFYKEAIKAKFEFLKIYSYFLIGLITAVVGMFLSESYKENNAYLIVFIIGYVALTFVMISFLVLAIEIRKLLKQLKK